MSNSIQIEIAGDHLANDTPRVNASPAVYERNLRALAQKNPKLAEQLTHTQPTNDILWATAPDGTPTAKRLIGKSTEALCSSRAPLIEAQRIAAQVDFQQHAAVVVLGFGLGYHIQQLVKDAEEEAAIFVYEPDLALLRAVLERIELHDTLDKARFITSSESSEIQAATQGAEAFIALGTLYLEHPASRQRLASSTKQFCNAFNEVMQAIRTTIVTTLVQSDVTTRNFLMNAVDYVTTPGIEQLKDIAKDSPAIVVSAGPSLQRNLHLLKDQSYRSKVIVVAVQTVLKPMLEQGIKPDFVTALDHHEISKRFYEGLTEQDVQGITLVAEPKANAAILDAFPGNTVIPGDPFVEQLLGDDLAPDKSSLIPGATVAHLAYYLARHMGCDPVMLIGQDLGFTDGQYYASGAAIHDVWAQECNEFNSIETMEWQRIARNRPFLKRFEDHSGKPIYSDAQMATYLAQFTRDFAKDAEQGKTVIDATEGGVRKPHSIVQTLEEALETHATNAPTAPSLKDTFPSTSQQAIDTVASKVHDRLERLRADLKSIHSLSKDTQRLLTRLESCIEEPQRANEIIRKIHANRDKVDKLETAFAMVKKLNQAGTLNRFKLDRAMRLDKSEGIERQRRQIQRDALNVNWIAQIAEVLTDTTKAAAKATKGGPKIIREEIRDTTTGERIAATNSKIKAAAVLALSTDPKASWNTCFLGTPAIITTIRRLKQSAELSHIAIVTANTNEIEQILDKHSLRNAVRIIKDTRPQDQLERERHRRQRIAKARAYASRSWRGGTAQLTIWDEAFDPGAAQLALNELGADAALILGPTWCSVDPPLITQLIQRHAESVEQHPFVFTNATPGIAPFLCSKNVIDSIDTGIKNQNHFASIGGILGYLPTAPKPDPIAGTACIQINPTLRSSSNRLIACDPQFTHLAEQSTLTAEQWAPTPTANLISALSTNNLGAGSGPEHLIIEPRSSTPNLNGERAAWWAQLLPESSEETNLSPDQVYQLTQQAAALNENLAVTFMCRGGKNGSGDPLEHPQINELFQAARSAGATAIHLRTDLTPILTNPDLLDTINQADVLSVDILADTPPTYNTVTGEDQLPKLFNALQSLLETHKNTKGPWIVARLTRADITQQDVESFYDRWTHLTASAVIDPLPTPTPHGRITPLKSPKLYKEMWQNGCIFVDSTGHIGSVKSPFPRTPTNVLSIGFADAVQRLRADRHADQPKEKTA